jgi:hypothetical protein
MTQSRGSEHYKQIQQEKTFGVASAQGADAVVAGRAAYRGENQRDYGSDPDLALDRSAFGPDF